MCAVVLHAGLIFSCSLVLLYFVFNNFLRIQTFYVNSCCLLSIQLCIKCGCENVHFTSAFIATSQPDNCIVLRSQSPLASKCCQWAQLRNVVDRCQSCGADDAVFAAVSPLTLACRPHPVWLDLRWSEEMQSVGGHTGMVHRGGSILRAVVCE